MREPTMTESEASRQRELENAPLVESDLLTIKAHVDAGTLSDDWLHALLGWIECGSWSDGRNVLCRLNPAQKHGCKALAAAAIHRQHGGRYVARGCAWVSDGTTLRAELR